MDFAFNEEQEALRSIARSFLDDVSGSEQVRLAMESEFGYDPQVWKQIGAELGWTSVIIPEEFGGLGLSYVELIALLEITGGALLCSPFFASVCLAGNAHRLYGRSSLPRGPLRDLPRTEPASHLRRSAAAVRPDPPLHGNWHRKRDLSLLKRRR